MIEKQYLKRSINMLDGAVRITDTNVKDCMNLIREACLLQIKAIEAMQDNLEDNNER